MRFDFSNAKLPSDAWILLSTGQAWSDKIRLKNEKDLSKVESKVPANEPVLQVWVYYSDYDEEAQVSSVALQLTGFWLPGTDYARLRNGMNENILDIPVSKWPTRMLELPDLGEYDCQEKCLISPFPQRTMRVDNLPRWDDNGINIPFTHKSTKHLVPLWMHCIGIAKLTVEDAKDKGQILKHFSQLAMRRIRLSFDHQLRTDDFAYHLEILSEMATLLSLSCTYRTDRYENRPFDQWTWLLHNPEIENAGIDCEDATETTLRVVRLIELIPDEEIADSALLKELKRLVVQDYTFVMVLGSLCIDSAKKENTYHVFALGLPRSDLASAKKSGSFSSTWRSDLPLVLLESTDYNTSLRQKHLERDASGKNNSLFFRQPLDLSDELAQIKTPLATLKIDDRYLSIISIIDPSSILHNVSPQFFLINAKTQECGVDAKEFFNAPSKTMLCPCKPVDYDIANFIFTYVIPPVNAFPEIKGDIFTKEKDKRERPESTEIWTYYSRRNRDKEMEKLARSYYERMGKGKGKDKKERLALLPTERLTLSEEPLMYLYEYVFYKPT